MAKEPEIVKGERIPEFEDEPRAVVIRDEHSVASLPPPMTADELVGQVELIQGVMRRVMKKGEHYGVIPGCGDKPTLLKPGAEKLATTFRLGTSYRIDKRDLPGGHREYEITCRLHHILTGTFVGEGVGVCSTMESKYRWRVKGRVCPRCGKEGAVIKGKQEYGGGWLCWQKKDGCGAKFNDNDPSIISQEEQKIENPDVADQFNTVKKMAKKRAMVDAILNATAASDIFTQDIEDMNYGAPEPEPEPRHERPPVPARPNTDALLSTVEQKALWRAVFSETKRLLGVTGDLSDEQKQDAFDAVQFALTEVGLDSTKEMKHSHLEGVKKDAFAFLAQRHGVSPDDAPF